MDFKNGKISEGKIYINDDVTRQLLWKEIKNLGEDSYVKINTKLNLIEGYLSTGVKSGNIYNFAISAGSFFMIPMGESKLIITKETAENNCTNEQLIEYNYYYF
jgi:hypothetical protein